MESKFNFKSAICTSRVQSERLLALGLKKETADMWYPHFAKTYPIPLVDEVLTTDDIPAWSLHRLIELKQPNTIDNAVVVLSREQTYNKFIEIIEKSIKVGKFPKEYLEE